jgi:glycosyltransferase involved in cell wall biosynthesis
VARLFLVEQSAIDIGGHYFTYTSAVAEGAVAAGLEVRLLVNRRLRAAFPQGPIKILPAFTRTWSESHFNPVMDWRMGNIAYEFDLAVRSDPPGGGDHVLFHTLSPLELVAVLSYLGRRIPAEQLPTYHLLLRYDPDEFGPYMPALEAALRLVRASKQLREHVRFHSDTSGLSEAFSKLVGLPVLTCPIPFPQKPLLDALERQTAVPQAGVLTASYLGDARIEKGYALLPGVVEALEQNYVAPGRVKFVIQSNFNVAGGEPTIPGARARLQAFGLAVKCLQDPLSNEAYYDVLAGADIVLLPYDPLRYRLRSSGILVEAMAAGKVVVTTDEGWLGHYAQRGAAVLFGRGGLAEALAEAIDRFPQLDARAKALQPGHLAGSTGRAFVEHLIRAGGGAVNPAGTPRPHVLLIMDGEAMILRNGASRVAETQMRYFESIGFRVTGLFYSRSYRGDFAAQAHWTETLRETVMDWPLTGFFVVLPSLAAADPFEAWARHSRTHAESSIASDLEASAAFDFGSDLLRHLHANPVDFVYLNYVTNRPIVEALGLADRPIICETHDIQSIQRALYAERQVSERDLDDEFAELAHCSALVSLNEEESSRFRSRLPGAPVFTTGVQLEATPPDFGVLAGARNIGQVLRCARPANPGRGAGGVHRDDAFERLARLESLDLLFVSSAHLPNLTGLKWFLDEVYRPHLAGLGFSLVVAGSIADLAKPEDEAERVVFVGRVANLAPLYAATKVVILPVTAGAGAPVKTMEALAFGKPVVASSQALRGTSRLSALGAFDDADAFASAVERLIGSQAERKRAAAASRALFADLCDPRRFHNTMDQAIRTALPSWTPSHTPPSLAPDASDSLIEWSYEVALANRFVRNLLLRQSFDATAAAALKNSSDGGNLAWEVLETLLAESTPPPVLGVDHALRAAVTASREQADCLRAIVKVAMGRKGAGEAFDEFVAPASELLEMC